MWSRILCVAIALLAAPLAATAASRCCGVVDACCDDAAPSCPLLPSGECALVAAGQATATLSFAPRVAPPVSPAGPAAAPTPIVTGVDRPRTDSRLTDPPRHLLHPPLRN